MDLKLNEIEGIVTNKMNEINKGKNKESEEFFK